MSRNEALLMLKQILVNRRDALRAALQSDQSTLTGMTFSQGDLADIALDSAYEDTACQMVEVESRELEKIEDAIHRIAQGDFGDCEGCQKHIPLARLEALPHATLCIKCQVILENSGFGHWSELRDDAYDSVQ